MSNNMELLSMKKSVRRFVLSVKLQVNNDFLKTQMIIGDVICHKRLPLAAARSST